MSDTPPKPKVGSLRDRIAAFEKPASSAPAPPPPTVRPKPAGFATWKPKVPSPPSSPAAGTTEHASSSAKAGGMSASDAKESITKAGSLKDRMAALQGKGAFGAPPPVAPKPAAEKPRWKPPPVIQAPVDDDDHPMGESSTANIAAAVERTISPPVSVKPQEAVVRAEGEETASSPPTAIGGEGEAEGDDSAEAGPVDPEEEERQRRAAIAARMARLGGARLGMAPPVFGKKPPVRKPTQDEAPKAEESKPIEEEPKRDISSPEAIKPAEVPLPVLSDENLLLSPPTSTAPAAEETLRTSPEYFPARKNSESTSILSSESTESHLARSPASMPVPSVPRRAGPPRKKPVKPAAPPPEVPEEETPAIEEAASPPAVEGESAIAVDSFETPRDDLLANVEALKAELQQEGEIPSGDHALAVPEPSLSPPSIAEEPTPVSTSPVISPPCRGSILIEEPSGIRSPPPTPRLDTAEEKESEPFEKEGEEDDEVAEALATPPIPVLLSPSREAPVAAVKEPAVPPAIASEEGTTDEAEEEECKKRVAERLAKMGGINPFAISSPVQAKPEQETPQVPASAVPSSPLVPSAAVQDRGSVIRSPEPARKDSTTESNAEEAEEAFDEDDGGDDFDHEPGPITNKHYEKSKDSPSLRAEPLERPNIPTRPPVPPPSTRPPVQVQQFKADEDSGSDYGDDDIANTSAPSIPVNPPAKLTSPSKPPSAPARPAQAPRRIVPQTPEENEVEEEEDDTDEEADERLAQSQLFIPPPTGRTPGAIPPNRRYLQDEDDGNGSESDSPALPVLHRRSLEVPPVRPTKLPYASDGNESWDPESDHDGQALPIPPRRTSGPPPPRVVPPPPPPALHHPPPAHRSPQPPAPAAVAHLLAISPPYVPRTASGSSEEILDEEEGDPIDPAFHSPSRRASTINLAAQAQSEDPAPVQLSLSPPPPPPTASHRAPAEQEQQPSEHGQDTEQLRRNTIAERMAKLGGIKFGAAPVPTPASRPPTREPSNEEEGQAEDTADTEERLTEISEEEEERARKERIAAKMATMGGMRIGMMPMGVGGFPPQRSHILKEETVASPPSVPPPARAVPPSRPPPPPAPPPQVPDSDSDYGSGAASEDGVKVEAEESSELEEVNYEDAEETEEEAPPPVPSRATRPDRRQSSMDQPTSPPIPPSRPPVPNSPPMRRSSVQTTRSIGSVDNAYGTPSQKSSAFMPSSQSEYVMVEEPESQETPPPPPNRSSRLPPVRATPQLPQAPKMEATAESISSQWELPSIPTSTFDFGGGADLSLSWTDAGESISPTTSSQPAASAPAPIPSTSKRATLPPAERQLSADDLIALWGRVGVQVCEIATSMYEKSKKTLIGDGTYSGFVQAVVATVPNALPVPTPSGDYGYLVYVQNGASVQKRASEIMPGDIVEIRDAKFKGHKGLQTYHQNVGGAGEDLVGVVGEFEAKKSKIRVFHANQHVGQQTVESVSYRLEDLKSGIVKVYRVLEA